MNFRLVIRPQVELEILEGAEYCEGQHPGLGIDFLNELDEEKAKLSDHPQFYSNTHPSAVQRRFLLDRPPYVIVYEISEEEAVVITVRHAKRNFSNDPPTTPPHPPRHLRYPQPGFRNATHTQRLYRSPVH